MKIANIGNEYDIYDDSLKTYDSLPPKVYSVRCGEMRGFYLEEHTPITVNEAKVYGSHKEKVEKILNAFGRFDRNLGVIFAGDKGIGKSLCSKLLAIEVNKSGMPVIIVDQYIQGIAGFIESIEQTAMIMFDEFDKTFGDIEPKEGKVDAQSSMLTLFDGLAQGKKLFVITCNEIRKLNDYLVNRPGRFHYCFRFDYPSNREIEEYLTDKLDPAYQEEIRHVVRFAQKTNLNYDCLRAIATELNGGLPFQEAIKDLNIMNVNRQEYSLVLQFNNGDQFMGDRNLDLFDPDEKVSTWLGNENGAVNVAFNAVDCIYDPSAGIDYVSGPNVKVTYDNDDLDEQIIKQLKASGVCRLILRKRKRNNYYYYGAV